MRDIVYRHGRMSGVFEQSKCSIGMGAWWPSDGRFRKSLLARAGSAFNPSTVAGGRASRGAGHAI